jgi:RNA recognition motif-containing protein
MSDKLYVSNLAAETTSDELRTLFEQHGQVLDVTMGINEHNGTPYALVQMESQKVATRANHALNGHDLHGQRLAVGYAEVDLSRDFTSRQRRDAEAIAQALGETEKVPVRQIETLVRLCGASFAQAIANEAKERVAAGEVFMTADNTRPRTVGGVFFVLLRPRLAPPIHKIIFNRKGKLPQPEAQPAETEADADTA